MYGGSTGRFINKGIQVLASYKQKWVVQSFDEVTPPDSIAHFPPPVIPEFWECSVVRDGAQLFQPVKTSPGGTSGVGIVKAVMLRVQPSREDGLYM